MSSKTMFDPRFPHGTPDGFKKGCHGSHCPAAISCRDVHARYRGDHRFRTQYDAGMSLAEIQAADAHELAQDRRSTRRRPAGATGTDDGVDGRIAANAARRGVNVLIPREPLHRLHRMGKTDRQIAEELGFTRRQVTFARSREGLPVNSDPVRRPRTSRTEEIAGLHQKRMTDQQIAKALGMKRDSVGRIRRTLNLPVIPALTTHDQIVDLHGHGLTNKVIAATLNVKPEYVRRRLKLAGLQYNPTPAPAGVLASQGSS